MNVEREDGPLRVYARLQRPEFRDNGAALVREGAVLDALAAGGVLVPRVLGVHSDPPRLLLECLPGTGDYAGLAEEDRWDVNRRFLEELVKLHGIDTAPFRAMGSSSQGTLGFPARRPRSVGGRVPVQADRSVPLIEFLCRWLRRHVPPAPVRASVLQGDTGPGSSCSTGPP